MPGVPTYSTGVAKNIYYNVCEMLSKIIRKEIEQNWGSIKKCIVVLDGDIQ